MNIQGEVDAAASEAVFRLEVAVMAEDHRLGIRGETLTAQIGRLARRYRLPSWFVRNRVETYEDAATRSASVATPRMDGTAR